MKVHHTLICCFFISLRDGITSVTNAETGFYGVIGKDVTATCSFSSDGNWKIICKEDCEEENILIKTQSDTDEIGRYSLQSQCKNTFLSDDCDQYVLSVKISELTKSDAGWYKCCLDKSCKDFEIIVAEALVDEVDHPPLKISAGTESSLTVRCSFTFSGNTAYFCRGECKGNNIIVQSSSDSGDSGQSSRYRIKNKGGTVLKGFVYVTITELNTSDTGRYRCHLSGLVVNSYREFDIIVSDTVVPSSSTTRRTEILISTSERFSASAPFIGSTGQSEPEIKPSDPGAGMLLYIGVTLAIITILLSVAVLIFCKKRPSKPLDHPTEMEYASVTEPNRVFEDIRDEDRPSRTPPMEISMLCSYVQHSKPTGAETSDEYSLATGPSAQQKAEDDSNKLHYSKVIFLRRMSSSSNTLYGNISEAVYAEPLVDGNSDTNHASDVTVYSTVTSA
ncbi:uncharacterized protein KZ484_016503 isoform 2-T2 [Pholidichthys leucotaenia]